MAFKFGTKARGAVRVLALSGALLTASCGEKPEATIRPAHPAETRPNILLVVADDLGPELGAYGDKAAVTPTIDKLAREGVLFTAAYAASGSDRPAQAALLTGVQPQTLGAVQDWSGEAGYALAPAPEVKAFPELLRRAGYSTFRIGFAGDPFGAPASLWDQDVADPDGWLTSDVTGPFFGMVALPTAEPAQAPKPKQGLVETVRGWFAKKEKPSTPTVASRIVVPPYLPDTPEVRAALKARYDRVHQGDARLGALLARLEKAGVLNNTVVIVTAENGPDLPRAERTVYDSGVRVPLIVRFPGGRGAGAVRRDPVGGVDLAPSILKLAGVAPLAWMQGADRFAAPAAGPRYVVSLQGRVDGAGERVRAVRDGRWLLIANEAPELSLASYAPKGAALEALEAARKANRLTPVQARLFATPRPTFELYDLQADPHQLTNLIADPARAGDVQRLAAALVGFNRSAPDYSTLAERDLRDRFANGGAAPVTSPPSGAVRAGKLTLETPTPGAAVLWRAGPKSAWRLYTGPVAAPAKAKIEAKAVRYGFKESPAVKVGG